MSTAIDLSRTTSFVASEKSLVKEPTRFSYTVPSGNAAVPSSAKKCCHPRCLGVSKARQYSLTKPDSIGTQVPTKTMAYGAQHSRCPRVVDAVLPRENELRGTTNPILHPHHTINLRHISALPPQPTAKGLADACAQQFGRLAKPPISAKTGDWDAVRSLPGHQLAPRHARKNH
jgi:hypothetical protein